METRNADFQFSRRTVLCIAFGLVAALALKFFWPLFVFDVPMGYDPGFYRYLFLKHAEAFPPFWIAELEPWARGHPLGLFFFSTVLLRLGVPVDWLLGWIWNLFMVVVPVVYASIMYRRHGTLVALGTLAAAVLSIAYFDGFAAMYWKTVASLFWCVLAYSAIERRSLWSIPLSVLTIITHHQTGLLFGLVLMTWLILPFMPFSRSTEAAITAGKTMTLRGILLVAGAIIAVVGIGLLAYLPIWQEAVLVHLPALLGKTEAASGSFPPLLFYVRTQGILLLLGIYGLIKSIRTERWTLWQLSVLWSAAFVLLRLIFYRRFFLQLDFFLLPFAGSALAHLWVRFPHRFYRGMIIALLALQVLIMQQTIILRGPIVDKDTLNAVLDSRNVVPPEGYVLALENESAVVLRGWMPDRHVGGPGLFESTWPVEDWEKFLLGTVQERNDLLATLPRPAFIFASPLFRSYYGEYAETLLRDPCLRQTSQPLLYAVICAPVSAQP